MTTLFALLVGIDQYDPRSNVRPLRGCVNDADAMAAFLRDYLSVPDENVKVLRSEQATRDGILNAFRSHLIENPAIEHGAPILFHYSGHGARTRDMQGIEPDGYHESLVAHDSRNPGNCDILDLEMGALLEELGKAKGTNITVVLDSCHSGSGTRDIPESESDPLEHLSRQIAPDERPLPPEVAAKIATYSGARSAGDSSVSGWTAGELPYVLLAGCRDEQKSREYEGAPFVWNGALTYFTLDYLKKMSPHTTYRDLYETVAAQVTGIYKNQEPQCEGKRDRVIFEGVRVERYPFINVTKVEGSMLYLDGGTVHNLHVGTELTLYPPTTRTLADMESSPALTKVRVVKVNPTTAEATFIQNENEVQAATTIPPRARGMVTGQPTQANRQQVALLSDGEAASDEAVTQLEELLTLGMDTVKPSTLITVVDKATNPPLLVKALAGQYHIYDGDGTLLVRPTDFSNGAGASAARQALEAIARYRGVYQLKSNDSATLDGKIKVNLRKILPDSQTELAPDPQPLQADGSILVPYEADKEIAYVVEVRNESTDALFVNVLLLTSDFAIYRLYPNHNQGDKLAAGGQLRIGLPQSGEGPIGPSLDDNELEATAYLKVVLTPGETDLEGLIQERLEVPSGKASRNVDDFLGDLLDAIEGSRGGGMKPILPTATTLPWTALTVPMKIVRAGDTVELRPNDTEVLLPAAAGGMTLTKPATFTGSVKVTTIEQEARALDDSPRLPLPASLLREGYQPMERPGTRATDGAQLVLEIGYEDDEQRRSITPDSPLTLQLGGFADADSEIVAVYYDGEDFIPGGYSRNGTEVVLTHLPPRVASPLGADEVGSRGILNATWLHLVRKTGYKVQQFGLHAVSVNAKNEVTRLPLPKKINAGENVCVFVHGFTSDSKTIVPSPYKMLQMADKHYDHYLSYDYDSLGMGVPDNAMELARELRNKCGLHADDGITVHLIAHSMGGFTTRHFIESDATRGYEIVDKVILAGVPNNGTPLANIANGGLWTATLLLNHVPGILMGEAVGTLVGAFHEGLEGLQDLKVNSRAALDLRRIDPLPIPYLVLTGENSAIEKDRWKALSAKIFDRTLDQIFGEDSDSVIGISSLRDIGVANDSHLTLAEILPCNHHNYFEQQEVIEMVKAFL